MKKDDIASKISDQQPATGLGGWLQGVQHFGVTVDDMAKSLEFYVDVLGGRIALSGTAFYGEILHNTMFQKEEIDAIQQGVSARSLGVPDVRDGTREKLDVYFISFGNTCVELIHFRDGRMDQYAPNSFAKLPSGVGHGNASHISFHVKDDVDLNLFSTVLENECQRRGIRNVVCNSIFTVRSHEERLNLPLKYAAQRFWKDSEYFIEGYSDSDFGDFEGWSLFYCKGPNGEQLEFNQVTRRAKLLFNQARDQYNELNDTAFEAPSRRTKVKESV